MSDTYQRERERAYAWQQLGAVFQAPERVFAIHYALQRLQRDGGNEPAAVAAIALRHLPSGAVTVFSIASEAEAAGIDLSSQPAHSRLAMLEYALLFKFNAFLEAHPDHYFLHWYMRDERFGFLALEQRHRKALANIAAELYGARSSATAQPFGFGAGPSPYPVHVRETHRIDLALVLRQLYGIGPARLKDLADANALSHAELIEGIHEPEMFERGNHARLEWSSTAKARLICELTQLAYSGAIRPPRDTSSRHRQPGGGNGLRIFINYRREDTEAAANWLHELLSEVLGHDNVFIDTDDIPAGFDFVEYLRRQIESCDVFLVMIGRQWAAAADRYGKSRLEDPNDFVRSEIRAALSRGIPVIPVLVEGTPMPQAGQLPEDLLALRRRQAVELRSREFRPDVERLVAKIRETTRLDRQETSQAAH